MRSTPDKDLYKQAVTLIGQMLPYQREMLLNYLKSMNVGNSNVIAPSTLDLDEPLGIIKTYLARKGVDTPPLHVAKKSGRFSMCESKIKTAWTWCRKQSSNKVERFSIFILACKCLEDFLLDVGIPTFYDSDPTKPYNRRLKSVGFYDIAMYADFMPHAVDTAFPSYMKAGLLRSIALRHIN